MLMLGCVDMVWKDKKVKKRDLKKVFDYFKKDQTVVIGYKSIPRSLLGISVLSLFISGIFGILIGLAFPNMISYVNEQTRSSVQHFQIPFYKQHRWYTSHQMVQGWLDS